MRIILDTNVLVSGIFFAGIPLKILSGIRQGQYRIVVTEDIVDEYRRTTEELANNFPNVDANSQLEIFLLSCEICQSQKLIEPVCADPHDDMFFACALASKARIIVSGDKHLLAVSGYQGINVLKPRQFIQTYLK